MNQAVKCWKDIQTYEDAFYLIDVGVVLRSRDLHHLHKVLRRQDDRDNQKIAEYFAERLIERFENRESAEIVLESLLLWLIRSMDEIYIVAFLQKILEHPERNEIIYALPGLLLSLDFISRKHREDAFDISVFLIAQIGIQLKYFANLFPEEFGDTNDVIEHINAFMISISNSGSYRVRQCLLNYFLTIHDQDDLVNEYFHRIMGRFGTTLFNQVFYQMFDKKTEVFSFQFLVDNLPYLFAADQTTQFTIHEILRHNMLKYPEKFSQFIQAYGPALKQIIGRYSRADQISIVENYLKHMAMLLKVVSQVEYQNLAKELLITLCLFREFDFSEPLLRQLIDTPQIKRNYRILLTMMMRHPNREREYIESISRFRCRKRGRKTRIDQRNLSIFQQIFCLK